MPHEPPATPPPPSPVLDGARTTGTDVVENTLEERAVDQKMPEAEDAAEDGAEESEVSLSALVREFNWLRSG